LAGGSAVQANSLTSERIYYRLEPAHEMAWRIPEDDVRKFASEQAIPLEDLRPFVVLPGWHCMFGRFSIED